MAWTRVDSILNSPHQTLPPLVHVFNNPTPNIPRLWQLRITDTVHHIDGYDRPSGESLVSGVRLYRKSKNSSGRYVARSGKKYGTYPREETPLTPDGLDVLDAGDVVEGVGVDRLASGSSSGEATAIKTPPSLHWNRHWSRIHTPGNCKCLCPYFQFCPGSDHHWRCLF